MMHQIKLTVCLVFTGIIIIFACKKDYSYEHGLRMNISPKANAGPDQLIILPKDSVCLDASNSKDIDGTITRYEWTKISGPNSYLIDDATSAITIVRLLTQGVYSFELTVTDNRDASSKDTVRINVNPVNAAGLLPVANAGIDQCIDLPTNSCSLNGSSSYDPDGNIVNYLWAKISGPVSFAIQNPGAAQTSVTNLCDGVYLFQLMVTDNDGGIDTDTVQVTVFQRVDPSVTQER